MRTSESVVNIAKALAAAQGMIKNPEANEEVKVHAKADKGGGLLYTYKYATLPKCFDAAREPFSKHGISHTAAVVMHEKGADLEVRLTHESGEWYESSIPLTNGLDAKTRAGEITFWKRYLFNGLAGIAGDDDPREESGERGPVDTGRPQQRPPNQPKNGQNVQKSGPAPAKPVQPVQKPASALAGTTFAEGNPSLKRARGVIVKEIMAIASALGIGQDLVPPDEMLGLANYGQRMFNLPLEQLTEDQLEKMLEALNADKRGK